MTISEICILQWNAQGLIHHGSELEKVLYEIETKPQIICVQETWFTNEHNFKINGYECYSRNRTSGQRGGIAIFIQENILVLSHDEIHHVGIESEIQKVKCVINNNKISLINIYNPCKPFSKKTMTTLASNIDANTIICGDFNSHNTFWGSDKSDKNGRIVEEFLGENNLVLLNDGEGTRIDPHTGKLSCLDLTISSPNLAAKCSWKASNQNLGSDHFIISITIGSKVSSISTSTSNNYMSIAFSKADMKKYGAMSSELIVESVLDPDNIQHSYDRFMKTLNEVVSRCIPPIPMNKKHRKNPVPWWNSNCSNAIKERNKIKNKVLKNCSQDLLIEYKKKKAEAQKILRESKTQFWRAFCSKINRFTPLSTVWKTVKSINSVKDSRNKNIPTLLSQDSTIANSDKEKANILAAHFMKASQASNTTPERATSIESELTDKLKHCIKSNEIDEKFKMKELDQAIKKSKDSTPGEDGISLPMVSFLSPPAKKFC